MTPLKAFKIKNSIAIILLLSVSAFAQTSLNEKISVPFSEPDRPGYIEVGLVHGSITVTAYNGKEIIIEAKARSQRGHKSRRHSDKGSRGMLRLNAVSTGLSVEEQHNKMSIGAASHVRAVDIKLQVPRKTSLALSTVNDGDIFVEGVEGELELNNVNGEIKVKDVSGTVLSNTTNGDVTVTFKKITPNKPLSFVSFNGDVDVTFPGDINAELKLKSEHGDIFTDYEITLEERRNVTREDRRDEGGKFQLEIESAMYGKVGKGGPEYHFSTYNGKIFIRKGK